MGIQSYTLKIDSKVIAG
jgi:ribonuclease HI